jgi:hypothetical protein
MSQLDDILTDYRNYTVNGAAGVANDETRMDGKKRIKTLMLELIGPDEERPRAAYSKGGITNGKRKGRNQMRQIVRKAIEDL